MVVNRQRRVGVDLAALRQYVARLHRELRLGRRGFDVCLAGDREIGRLNAIYRGKRHPTDVLSFRWSEEYGADGLGRGPATRAVVGEPRPRPREVGKAPLPRSPREFADFLGDIVISAETARRNARIARHSTAREVRRLILHGALHLMGYDHETDRGEMALFEREMQGKLGL